MSSSVYFLDFKSPDQVVSARELAENALKKNHEPLNLKNREHWALYSNDRLVTAWQKKIRPRSRMILARRTIKNVELKIIYRDSSLVVLDKPAGLATQKTLKDFEDNLYERVRFFLIHEKAYPVGLPYAGLHHRLDRGTSGLVLMTLKRSANKEVSDLFKTRKIKKTYGALTEPGEQRPNEFWRQEDPIARGPAHKKKFFFQVSERGDQAITEFQLLGRKREQFCEFRCFPKTGRTHQIRVHLAHKGFPILGDSTYGRKKSGPRLMLHATQLNFSFGGQEMEFKSPLDLKKEYQDWQASTQA